MISVVACRAKEKSPAVVLQHYAAPDWKPHGVEAHHWGRGEELWSGPSSAAKAAAGRHSEPSFSVLNLGWHSGHWGGSWRGGAAAGWGVSWANWPRKTRGVAWSKQLSLLFSLPHQNTDTQSESILPDLLCWNETLWCKCNSHGVEEKKTKN